MGERLLERRIEFHPARKPGLMPNHTNFHLETLNPIQSPNINPNPNSNLSSSAAAAGKKKSSLPQHAALDFHITVRRIGAGLENLGNTCFLNSVLQCLTYTEPFAAYLQTANHKSSCHTSGFCAMCSIQNHVNRALHSTGRILAPKDLVMNLRSVSRNFRNARQEDAHEYMVHLLESMHKSCLPSGLPTESPSAYDKSLVHKIFGGRLRSQVKCMQCSHCSNTFDPFLDLSLEIVKADTLIKALTHFTAVEQLDGGERHYHCQRCCHKVKALKQLTINKPPYVLTIHLKRFSSNVPGQKINKKVDFDPTLDLKPFVTGFNEGDLKYTLYGVLVHAGWSTHSGHYYCFVRTSSGLWHSLDDNRVIQVSEKTVLQQKAYMLFYVRDRERHMEYSKPVLCSKPIERQYPHVKVEALENGLPLKLKTTNSSPSLSAIIDKNKGTNTTPVKLPETVQIEKPKKKVLRNPNMGIGSRLLRKASLVNKRKRKRKKTDPPTSTSASERTGTENTDIRESNAAAPQPSLEEKSSSKSLEFTVSDWEIGSKDRQTVSIGYVPTDEWDEEYDRGKRKKIRNSNSRFGDSKNPFQEIATKLRKDKLKTL